jgi:putative oxidoreductase
MRLYWGWQLAQSSWGKLHHLSNVGEYFATLGLPMPAQMAVFIACVEFFGGIFFALGLASRITGMVLSVNLTMAYLLGDREALLSFFSDPDKFTAAAPFAFLMVALIVLIFGAGRISADTAITFYSFPRGRSKRMQLRLDSRLAHCEISGIKRKRLISSESGSRAKSFEINGAGGGNRTHGLGIMRPSLYH